MSKVLNILISINVQAKFDINLGSQGMVITIKGWLSNRVFMQVKHMQFYKTGHWVVFIKTRAETCIKGWDWTCRLRSLRGGLVLRAQGRRTGHRSPAHSMARWWVLLRSLRGLQRKRKSTQSIHRKRRLNVELESGTHKIWDMKWYFWVCF